jgi:hypothetical protein
MNKKVRLETQCLPDTKEYIRNLGHGSLTVGLEILVEQHKKFALHDSVRGESSARDSLFLSNTIVPMFPNNNQGE